MGCFNVTCGFTDLPITSETPIRMMAIRFNGGKQGNPMIDSLDCFEPVSILARGTYNDYGWIDFAEGEEERFFNSAAKLCGVNITKEENSNAELPAGVFIWFIREDAFALTAEMPFESIFDGEMTVAQGIELGKARFRAWQLADQSVASDSEDMDARVNVINLEERFKSSLVGRHHNLRTYLMIAAKRGKDDAEQSLNDLFDQQQILFAMDCVNRPLMPTRCGYQDFSTSAYVKLASFVGRAEKILAYED